MKGNRSRAHVITRSSGLKSLARSVGRHKRSSVARQAMRDSRIRAYIINILGRDIRREMKRTCSDNDGNDYYLQVHVQTCIHYSFV